MSGVDRGVLHSAQELAIELGLRVLGILGKPFRQNELTVLLDKVPRDVEGETKRKSLTESAISEEELRQAIANRELTAFYQPQVEIGQRSIVGAEALVRWRHPQRGLVPPGLFIPLAEETGLVDDIAYMMLHEATG
ncbi:MAG: EAL domain-containing protein, partial [Gammaproteobacteria bacterium]|nr:EAL domain-containing protein [Gammaproteobacteria bacterium]